MASSQDERADQPGFAGFLHAADVFRQGSRKNKNGWQLSKLKLQQRSREKYVGRAGPDWPSLPYPSVSAEVDTAQRNKDANHGERRTLSKWRPCERVRKFKLFHLTPLVYRFDSGEIPLFCVPPLPAAVPPQT